jgi:hypothetical protein
MKEGIIIMKKEMETKLIDFEGGQLLGVKTEDGKVYLGINKACQDIGLTIKQAEAQVLKIQDDIVLNKGMKKLSLKFEGEKQARERLFLHEKFVTLWLAKISLTPKMQKENPETVQKLANYQLEASEVLHNAFMATEEQKEEFYSTMGLEGEIVELKTTIDNQTIELKETKETLNTTINRLDTLIDNSTINSRQAQKLLHHAKDRINTMLGGAHSEVYKRESRKYFKNLWLQLGERFGISTYKDLNPLNYNDATTFISNWSMM